MNKVWASCVAVLILAGAAGGVEPVTPTTAGLYEPGMVRAAESLAAPLEPPAQPEGESTWLVEPEVRLAYTTAGEGRPVLVIHGGPGVPYAQPWAGLEPLQRDYKFYYFHQRGCGDSTRPIDQFESRNFLQNMTELDRALGIAAQIADIERIRRILGEEKLILVGHSYGGFLAALYAAEFPERTEAIVLVAPAGLLQLPAPDVDLLSLRTKQLAGDERREFEDAIAAHMNFGELFTKNEAQLVEENTVFGAVLLKALGESADSQPTNIRSGGWMVQAQYFAMGLQHDYRDALKAVQSPVLILHGEQDQLTLPGARVYEQSFPRAKLKMIAPQESSRAGHFVFNDEPAAFSAAVREFLPDDEDE